MNKTNLVIALFLTLLLLNACSSIVEGLGGTKKKGSDEFLVKKKSPLVLPPSYGELPEPGKKTDENLSSIEENTLSIKEIITQSSSMETNIEKKESSSSIEKSIIEKINKKKINEQNSKKVLEEIKETPKKKNFLQKFKAKLSKQ